MDENDKITVKITDFGQVLKFGGTPGYASPENFSEPVMSKSDIWSFGKTLLYLYTSQGMIEHASCSRTCSRTCSCSRTRTEQEHDKFLTLRTRTEREQKIF